MTGVYYQNLICRVLDESTTDSCGIAVNEIIVLLLLQRK